jgi:hypothetical protein
MDTSDDDEFRISVEKFIAKQDMEAHERYLRNLNKEEKPFTGFSAEDLKLIDEIINSELVKKSKKRKKRVILDDFIESDKSVKAPITPTPIVPDNQAIPSDIIALIGIYAEKARITFEEAKNRFISHYKQDSLDFIDDPIERYRYAVNLLKDDITPLKYIQGDPVEYKQYFTNWIGKSSSFIPNSKYFSVKWLKS